MLRVAFGRLTADACDIIVWLAIEGAEQSARRDMQSVFAIR